jgi:beta-glucosidase
VPVNSKLDSEFLLQVTQEGEYLCTAQMAYDRSALAQSSCSLSINGEFAMSLSVNGTDSKTVSVEGVAVQLQPGIYRFATHFVKKGAELKSIEFIGPAE